MNIDKILTIIIPAYNMQDYLNQCIQSLIIDNFNLLQRIEIIIVNDGSKDNTLKIAQEYKKKYHTLVEIIDKENNNYGSCINAGLRKAKGKYVKVLDADDTYNRDELKKFVIFLCDIDKKNENYDMLLTNHCIVDKNGIVIQRIKFELETETLLNASNFSSIGNISMHNIAYRTELLRKINYIQTEKISYTDQEWVYIPLRYIERFCYLDYYIYNYLVGREGQTMDPDIQKKNLWMSCVCKKKIIDGYEKQGKIDENVFNLVSQSIAAIYYGYLLSYKKESNKYEIKELDEYLKKKNKKLYYKVGESYINTKLKLKYIKYWRKKSFLYYVNYQIWRTAKFIKNILHK